MNSRTRRSYQEGSYERVKRTHGPDVWVYRWWEKQEDGTWRHPKKVIGDVKHFPKLADIKKANENFRAAINAKQDRLGKMTVRDAWGHFQEHELYDVEADRSPSTIQNYKDYFGSQILPEWGDTLLDDVKTIEVQRWLRSLSYAPGTKAKLRNLMSALFVHCKRWELYHKDNPITLVRQGAKRRQEPETLNINEISVILSNIKPPAIRVMVATAGGSALRRSEVRGLRWRDLDFEKLWFHLHCGVVRKDTTKMKTEASRKGIPMLPELAEVLRNWREVTPYPSDDDWVFASPFTKGKRPYWPDSALADHIRPAAVKAGITKKIGWHTFRHSVGKLLNDNGENIKTIQELLRHANSRITMDIYVHGDEMTKRNAIKEMSGIFLVPPLSKAS